MTDKTYEIENGRRVSESALIERINKKLADESLDLKAIHMAGSPSIGHFYEQDSEHGDRKDTIDLEAIGRELGVLASDETIARTTGPLSDNHDHLNKLTSE